MNASRRIDAIRLSSDGYIRATFGAFLLLPFENRRMWIDAQLHEDLAAEDIAAARAGYCEWRSRTGAGLVVMGWAWYEETPNGDAIVAPGGIGCNVMLVTASGGDLGYANTQRVLHEWLAMQAWRQESIAPAFCGSLLDRS
ncbi:MAG TPA: DUF4902 domain-containing protein [Rudaea sp.]